MALKKIGYYISKGRCVKAYSLKKKNRSGRLVNKRVNSRGKVLGKKTKVYKRKSSCMKVLKSKRKSSRKKSVKRRRRRSSPKRRRRRSSPKRRRRHSSPKRRRRHSSPRRRSRFGNIKAGVPKFATPLTLQLGQTYDNQRKHYLNTSTSFISSNFPKDFNWTTDSMGKSSLPPYKNINKFGQYFH
jgi:hypothetical protein